MEPWSIEWHRTPLTRLMKIAGALFFALFALVGAASAQRNRITGRIDNLRRVSLQGHVPARATAENDRGRVSPSLELSFVTLALTPTAAQQAELDQLLAEQQTPGSPNYHQW